MSHENGRWSDRGRFRGRGRLGGQFHGEPKKTFDWKYEEIEIIKDCKDCHKIVSLFESNKMKLEWLLQHYDNAFFKALSYSFESKKENELNMILLTFTKSQNCQKYSEEYVRNFKKSSDDESSIKTTIENISTVYEKCLLKFKTNYESLNNVIDALDSSVRFLSKKYKWTEKTIKKVTKNIFELRDNYIIFEEAETQTVDEKQTMVKKYEKEYRGPENDDDFRSIPELPTLNDIEMDEKTGSPINELYLRPIKIHRPYASLNEMLDINYRLMREDLINPLREGIFRLKEKNKRDNRHNNNNNSHVNLKVYEDVKIIDFNCVRQGIHWVLQFQPMPKVNWEVSKRLIHGSLLCLTANNFKSVIFATVVERNTNDLKKGIVSIILESSTTIQTIDIGKEYKMTESPVFFEAYRHVLKGLQLINEDNLPFIDVLVNYNNEDNAIPRFIRNQPFWNIHNVFPVEKHEGLLKQINLASDNIVWPNCHEMGLDEGQLAALRLSFRNKVTIIQGPPGTGKTFVGLKLAHILLSNIHSWKGINQGPLLLVAYTNHALDQFLEGILQFEQKIIRVGNRSSSDKVKPFLLNNIRNSEDSWLAGKFRKSKELYCRISERLKLQRFLKNNIEALKDYLLRARISILKMVDFSRFSIGEEFIGRLKCRDDEWGDDNDYNKSNPILNWLMSCDSVQYDEWQSSSENEDDDDDDESLNLEEEELKIRDISIVPSKKDEKHKHYEKIKSEFNQLISSFARKEQDDNYPDDDDDGVWEKVNYKKKFLKCNIKKELNKSDSKMTEQEINSIQDIWCLRSTDRWKMYRYFRDIFLENLQELIAKQNKDYQSVCNQISVLNQEADGELLLQASIIAMTTTVSARMRIALEKVKPTIVMFEEAAEVFESHVLTSLTSNCQQLILIGDHQQLRPKPNVYRHETEYNLDVSIFERLIANKLPHVTLNVQRRMRPEISRLISTIYPTLKDHEASVKGRENIRGICKNVFFFTHEIQEDYEDNNHKNEESNHSKSNLFEAELAIGLAKYLRQQNYTARQITILTPYLGQVAKIKTLMKCGGKKIANIFQSIRVLSIDNYQGEENDIIILSLVRSNSNDAIGFVKVENRICVMLSRAKLGMYIFGDSSCMERNSPLWRNVIGVLNKYGEIGPSLELVCVRHADQKSIIKEAKDFDKVPEGGCLKACKTRLKCGHVCELICHSYDIDHVFYNCMKACENVCENGHKCGNKCYENCNTNICQVGMKKRMIGCNHINKDVPCSIKVTNWKCQCACERILSCGHRCQSICGGECFCEMKCEILLDCGHMCTGDCLSCGRKRLHEPCSSPCNRTLICNHQCNIPCSKECPPCNRPCNVKCEHSTCTKKCGEICFPCIEPCERKCMHRKCNKRCQELCSIEACKHSCKKLLDCKHKCIGLCGDPCPKQCRICTPDFFTEIFFGTEEDKNAKFVTLPDCGHTLEKSGLDTWMKQDGIGIKKCPMCSTAILNCRRYKEYVISQLIDIDKVKKKVNEEISIHELKMKHNDIFEYSSYLSEQYKSKKEFSNGLIDRLIDEFKELDIAIMSINNLAIVSLRKVYNLEIKISIMKKLERIFSFKKPTTSISNSILLSSSSAKISKLLTTELRHFFNWLKKIDGRFSNQQEKDFNLQLHRFEVFSYYYQLSLNCPNLTTKWPHHTTVTENLRNGNRIENQILDDIFSNLKTFGKTYLTRYQELTVDERNEIVLAMKSDGVTSGHWYKCPNGHVYAIGECGGATVTSTCPECRTTIGGTNHALTVGNSHAGEFDGSRHGAWTEAANMENFLFEDN